MWEPTGGAVCYFFPQAEAMANTAAVGHCLDRFLNIFFPFICEKNYCGHKHCNILLLITKVLDFSIWRDNAIPLHLLPDGYRFQTEKGWLKSVTYVVQSEAHCRKKQKGLINNFSSTGNNQDPLQKPQQLTNLLWSHGQQAAGVPLKSPLPGQPSPGIVFIFRTLPLLPPTFQRKGKPHEKPYSHQVKVGQVRKQHGFHPLSTCMP